MAVALFSFPPAVFVGFALGVLRLGLAAGAMAVKSRLELATCLSVSSAARSVSFSRDSSSVAGFEKLRRCLPDFDFFLRLSWLFEPS